MRRFFGGGGVNRTASESHARPENNDTAVPDPVGPFRGFSRDSSGNDTADGTAPSRTLPTRAVSHMSTSSHHSINRPNNSAATAGWSGFRRGLSGDSAPVLDQAKMERLVATSSRSFGQGVQHIVVSAKAKQGGGTGGSANADNTGEWKHALLKLLGQEPPKDPFAAASPDTDATTSVTTDARPPPVTRVFSSSSKKPAPAPPMADIDILIQNSSCDKFVLRCVEYELPPNLVHCLRLLRVLELQHANNHNAVANAATVTTDTTQDSDDNASASSFASDSSDMDENGIRPLSKLATAKVTRLLCLLCTDTSVGEQLRPHLFGLLALSGASYPPSGVHVAQAASSVICQFSKACLTANLVWFVHDRKMLIHMTDDVKELSGMTTAANADVSTAAAATTVVPMALVAEQAERAGLMVIALQTVVKMVHESIKFETVDLVKDFEAAGGFEVVHHAILHATGANGKGLLELLPMLICCPNELLVDSEDDGDIRKLASNFRVFDLLGDLVTRSNPLLRRKRRELTVAESNHDANSELRRFVELANPDDLEQLSLLSIRIAAKERLAKKDKVENADGLGVAYDLSSELMAITLQLFADHPNNYEVVEDRLHVLTFSLLAFPCYRDQDLKNLILKTLEFVLTAVGTGEEATPISAIIEIFFALCRTLLKGDIDFEDEESIALLDKVEVMDLLATDADLVGSTLEKLLEFDQRVAPQMVESGVLTTNLDSLLSLVSELSANSNDSSEPSIPPAATPQDKTFAIVCRVLKLVVAHKTVNLTEAADNTSSVRETTNLHTLFTLSVNTMGVEACLEAAGVFEAYLSSFSSANGLNSDMRYSLHILSDLVRLVKVHPGNPDLIKRVTIVVSMLRSILEGKSHARSSFRTCDGFTAMLSLLLSLKGVGSMNEVPHLSEAVIDLVQSVVGLLDAAIGMKSRNSVAANELSPLSIKTGVCVDFLSSQLSSESASSVNRNYMRQQGFYLSLATAIAGTELLSSSHVDTLLDLALGHIDPDLRSTSKVNDIQKVRNPDAIRLALGIALSLPDADTGNPTSIQIMDRLLRLCEHDRKATTLPQISSCGLCYSLTSPNEFGPVLFDSSHSLQSRFSLILNRIAAYNMSYMDFVSLLRNLAGPMLCAKGSDGRVRLPVITSSIKNRSTSGATAADWSNDGDQRELGLARRLESICDIAKRADRFARVSLGGDTVNTIAVLMHKVRLEERLRASAEEGRLRFLEIECIDASALATENSGASNGTSTTGAVEKVWSPLSGSGFTFSLWLRHDVPSSSTAAGNIYILDICNLSNIAPSSSSPGSSFLSVWYDIQNQRFNVMSSASYRGEPTCFPVSPLKSGEWHHVLITYTPAKRAVIARKSVFAIFVDGRPLQAEVRVESVTLPPNSRVVIGAPNPALAVSGVVRGVLPVWEAGPMVMLSTVLLDLDATALFAYGPGFPGLLWGDRPQRLSLAATGTAAFSMLSKTGEAGSIAVALRRRDIPKLEQAGYSSRGHTDKDSLSSMSLLCEIPPECVIFGFQAATTASKMRNEALKRERRLGVERLVNLARLNYGNEIVSTDAVVYGEASVISPLSFKDCLRWVGGPVVLIPLVNTACSPRLLALALQMIRLGSEDHIPNLEMLQAGGGYRILSVLLQGKDVVDEACLDQCLAFAIHSFDPNPSSVNSESSGNGSISSDTICIESSNWVFSDLDAMKHLLLNHQVWDLRKFGPTIPLRLLRMVNRLVDHRAVHKAFNARRLHQIGIIRWALHLSIEAAELYTTSDSLVLKQRDDSSQGGNHPWFCDCPRVADVSVGGDPGNPFLLECKSLLRRVLTFMLTPGDLEALVESIVFTVSINGVGGKAVPLGKEVQFQHDDRMLAGPTLRLHLVRLLEELIVDGVNEIVAVKSDNSGLSDAVLPHAGGVASPNQPYFSTVSRRGKTAAGEIHPKHQQAQNFLSAFASFLTPVWFATVLEGCQEEASASALLRLMILMLQGSASFEAGFLESGAFSPFVLSIPKYSTCPGITLSMLSQLMNIPILHLHSLPTLDPEQLCEVFDAEGANSEYSASSVPSDPSSGIFALVVECVGRNVQLIRSGSSLAPKAAATNEAIVKLLTHRHSTSPTFRGYCNSSLFLEPLSQALCLVYDEKVQSTRPSPRSKRLSLLANVPKGLSPTERFVGSLDDPDSAGMGIVRLIRMIISEAVVSGPCAGKVVSEIFRAFPIHASPQQVEAFHLVLIEHCCAVIDGVLQRGEGNPVTISNCLGICSVFLDHEVGAFFTAEAAVTTVKVTLSILNALLKFDTPAIYSLANAEHSMLTRDASYLANLAFVTSLRVSLPYDSKDRGDEDLQLTLLGLMVGNVESLLLLPARDRKSNWKVPTGKIAKPSPTSKLFEVWQSASVARMSLDRVVFFPDSYECVNPELVSVAPLLVSLHRLLLGSRDDIKGLSISLLVSLLQHRSHLLSELLVAEVKRNGRSDTIDVVNRGGFKALLTASEAANIGEKNSAASLKRTYGSFFDWFERNVSDVQLVFDSIEKESKDTFPGLQHTATPQTEAVESEQKLMLMRLSSRSADRTTLGGLERAELARLCSESTTEIHNQWKRQGFDDLAYGAMKWKVLLRQMKGSSSIWEGGPRFEANKKISILDRLKDLESGKTTAGFEEPTVQVKRWKLDLAEGYERQRRRLLPNYEFHGLYNLDEDHDVALVSDTPESLRSEGDSHAVPEFLVGGGQMEATAEMLKDLNIKRTIRTEKDDEYDEQDTDSYSMDSITAATTGTTASAVTNDNMAMAHEERPTDVLYEGSAAASQEGNDEDDATVAEKDSSSYELITGLLQAGDWPEKSYNVQRCTGLEVTKALLLWCSNAIYIIDGFEHTDGVEGKISRVERERSSFHISLRTTDSKVQNEDKSKGDLNSSQEVKGPNSKKDAGRSGLQAGATQAVLYEHRSQRILLADLYSVYRRRYQLQQTGLEFYDVHKNSALIAFDTHADREEVLSKTLNSSIPNSIFSSSYGTFINYTKFMRNLKSKITSQWQSGKMSNFEFIMQLNSLAGRSFNDLTQYPVFPWIIADYESEELDLTNPNTFRDLSKPMGALGEERAQQFRDRYEALSSTYFGEDDPPPFHYGTHYSCAAYVLYYLMRLEPFSRLALALQGGKFDVADRLFDDVGRSWRSASAENLQDVRELIPEFYYLPDFLVNTNHFDFGETQRGITVHNVSLPKWAKGDPKRFIRLNRQALESEYVSKNLHKWIDLVFGSKQRGEEAIESLNTFVHVTYEGEVDIDAMTDPIQRQSTISQIQNFGQTPSRLERWPFPQKLVPSAAKDRSIDFGALAALAPLTPPLCVVGAPHRIHVKHVQTDTCKLGLAGQADTSVGDVSYVKGQIMTVGKMGTLNTPAKKYFRFGGLNNGLTVHSAAVTSRYREINKLISVHDDLHRAPISTAKCSRNGNWIVTGCVDSTLRVWASDGSHLHLRATLCGHDGSHIECIDVSTECGVIVSGCGLGKVQLWDLRTLTFVRSLRQPNCEGKKTLSVSINHKNGNIITLVGTLLSVFDVNGNILSLHDLIGPDPPTCAVATDCPEWSEKGIVVVTGHESGEVRLWSMDFEKEELKSRGTVEGNTHTSRITALHVTGVDRQDTLLVGDCSGRVSVCKTSQLDAYSADELAVVVSELRNDDNT